MSRYCLVGVVALGVGCGEPAATMTEIDAAPRTPVIEIVGEDGEFIAGSAQTEVHIDDRSRVVRLELKLDDTLVGSGTPSTLTYPYQFGWSTTNLGDGEHVLTATAILT